jgi:hypothetical protein
VSDQADQVDQVDQVDRLTGLQGRDQGHRPASANSPSPAAELAIQYAIARAFAEADQLNDVAVMVLQVLTDSFGWLASGLWVLDPDLAHVRCAAAYPMDGPLAPWTAETLAMRLPIGTGLPGRVWATELPSWIRDIHTDDDFRRRDLARVSNIRHGFAFPILVNGSVGAVIELFANDVRDVDARQTEFFDAVGHQLGSFIERIDTRREVKVSEARKTGVLNAAVDAIVSADRAGISWSSTPRRRRCSAVPAPRYSVAPSPRRSCHLICAKPTRWACSTTLPRVRHGSWAAGFAAGRCAPMDRACRSN